ncbi:hyperosmotically inducible protein [Parabacteroides sp. PF5-5]|uniref:BON domain-containing protein n=1 Tax=unclassified Parabacteroides TaxID=2649774 RepID=UPI002473727D|nr:MULTISPECIES: BON domain-containing protein [unclassified Parabacteroides]MDH6305020.1 hyperosmotically inducible protein [Parabacteroides sp. PH5-39]MDH6315895.1 hyperosmotically inducible protein [Parabacteroides sp. PF5-13]MDH6319552.1 hyperosmotically inducible protein [Parabacteroides sp. PH5-13]MDH6323283.1 hyperosmotically inducible protein [Parabacteroides sp. PH5-8]MDH6327209.1 hyperosmotically inducible protein [Parabacteroides sp. PH5-41]
MEKTVIKKTVLVCLCSLFAVCFLGSCKPSDAKLQQQVETVLTAAYPTVSAVVKDGVVTLTGAVESDEIKAGAEAVAKAVKDIKSVANNITVTPPVVKINPDVEISQLISTALSAAGFAGINVAVQEGEVTLTGDVKRADLQKVMQVANESNPKKVINQLTIK